VTARRCSLRNTGEQRMSAPRLKIYGADVKSCQLCRHRPLVEFTVPGSTTLWRCAKCGLYQDGRLVDNSAYAADYHRGYEHHRPKKLRTATVRLNRIAPLVRRDSPRLLDVGSSVGCVIEAALNRGWDATGIDVSESAVQFCREQGLPCRLFDGVSLPFPDAAFDVLTSWHVIEHVADVEETLAEWFRVLRPGGVLALETPDASSPIVRLRGSRYRKFWAPEHTYTFTPSTLAAFIQKAGFTVEARPVVGRLAEMAPRMAGYAVAYQAYHGIRKLAGISKAFQIFARRPEAAARRQRAAA
jgi:2-polyprenyl-3-methyl-5-hydroxy-6-metoxy-1,4-benzoquinol methylase